METAELKKKLIAKINDTQNSEILESIMRLLEIHAEEVYILNDAQRVAIEEAREDYRNGRYTTHEEVQKDIKKWLKK